MPEIASHRIPTQIATAPWPWLSSFESPAHPVKSLNLKLSGPRGALQSSDTFRLTVASGMPSLRDAAERLPASTAASRVDMDSSRSITLPYNGRIVLELT